MATGFLIVNIINLTVNLRRDISISYSRITLLSLVFCILEVCIMILIISDDIGLQGGLISVTNTVQVFYVFLFVICSLMLQLTSFYTKDQFKIIEFSCIILFIIIGAISLISAKDFVSIFLSIELQSFSLYLLSSIYKDSELSIIGALIYFLLGSLSSCFIVLSLSLYYGNYGSIYIEFTQLITTILDLNLVSEWYNPLFINISLLIFSIGLLFKLGAAPFHFWSPDVYDSVPTIVTTFIAILPKISIFLLLWGLIYYLNYNFINSDINVLFNLILSSYLSLIIGTVVGLTQFRIKRLLAYSTISHVGFLLLSLSISSAESIQGFLFYLTQYSIINLNSFIILLIIGFYYVPSRVKLVSSVQTFAVAESNQEPVYQGNDNKSSFIQYLINTWCWDYIFNKGEYKKTISNITTIYYGVLRIAKQKLKIGNDILKDNLNSPLQLISQLKGYFYVSPYLTLSLSFIIFSFAGIPPFIGFFGKQLVLNAALNKGFFFLAFIIIITSIIGAFYYLNLVENMFFFFCPRLNISSAGLSLFIKPRLPLPYLSSPPKPLTLTISITTICQLFITINNQEWLSFCTILTFYRL